MVTEFIDNFKATLGGKQEERGTVSKEIKGGAKIKEFFERLYLEYIQRGFYATKDYSGMDIEKAI